MARVSRAVVESRFRALCDALGKRIATGPRDVGSWRLDYAQCYGGYTIVEVSTSGGEFHPFSALGRRLSGAEMEEIINFTLRAIQIDRLNGADSAQYWPDDKITNPRP